MTRRGLSLGGAALVARMFPSRSLATAFRTLNDGTRIPLVAFGTGTAVFGRDAYEPVLTALKAGARHIDAAHAYQNEESVGRAIRHFLEGQKGPGAVKREDIFVTTKLYLLAKDATVADTLKIALEKLRIDYCDLYLVHTPEPYTVPLAEVWKGMEEAKQLGLTKSIGVSNWRLKDYDQILPTASIIPSVNQVRSTSSIPWSRLALL